MSSIKQVSQTIKNKLNNTYEKQELNKIIFLIFEYALGINSTEVIAFPDKKIPEESIENINNIIKRLKNNEPLQYIFGETEFYGLPIKVNPSVLIPRPETEELVDLIIKDNKLKAPKIADFGTGSGCIAISLKKNIPSSQVFGFDISEKAIYTAQQNASLNKVDVKYLKFDILKNKTSDLPSNFDIIVSNPPYVCNSEKTMIKANVINFEPHSALFVPDDTPLVFYKRIGEIAQSNLKTKGKLYFEINEAMGKKNTEILTEQGFKNITLIKDLNKKDRIISCIKQ